MKKIITGYFFRLFRSFEFWALMVLFLVATYYIVFPFIGEKNEITVARGTFVLNDGEDGINAENINQYRFANSGISARNLYKVWIAPIPQDEFDIILHGNNYYMSERETVTTIVGRLHVVPAIVVLILIPLFLGRLFSDGTIKSFIACGHSKGKIYFASLLFSFLMNIALILMTLIFFAFICLYFKWLPPIYLPMLLARLILEITLTFVLSSACIAALFSSKKELFAVIVSFLLIIPMVSIMLDECGLFSVNEVLDLDDMLHRFDGDYPEDYEEFKTIVSTESANALESRFNIFEFDYYTYYKGRRLKLNTYHYVDPVTKYALMTRIYLNPYVSRKIDGLGMDEYQKYRDGILAINIANNVFWIIVTSVLGILIFKKREFK